ncbi:MAG: methyltransferase domain-containing protein [Bacteriovoracaceae bacterium]|nr:methyltransferase domain-containing protein [Bacteriovoracaceae bacterium]
MKKLISILLVTIFFSCTHSNKHDHPKGHHKHHSFSDAQKWEKVFESKKRDLWQKPELIFQKLKIQKKDHIADIGSATGYFPVRLAKIASRGKVWAIDIEPNLIDFLNKRAQKEGLTNLVSILGTPSNPLIPSPVDMILTVDTYHHISDRVTYFSNLKSKLKDKGRLVIIDFKKGKFPVGPKDSMKLESSVVIKELSKAGFNLKENIDILPYQYILVFGL